MSYGFITRTLQKEFLKAKVPVEKHKDPEVITLNGNENQSETLYFWQLHSILGTDRIQALITNFYQRVFNDRIAGFGEIFQSLGSMEHHIQGQTSFWQDAMGGGKRYAGGEFRLKRHHDLAKHIMNTRGAARWSHHMRDTLSDLSVDLTSDKRVRKCIITFINFFMEKYAEEYDFKIVSRL